MIFNTFDNTAEYYDYFNYPEVLGDSELYLKYCLSDYPILEIGCGTGRIGIEIAKKGYFIDELDISEKMLDVYNKKLMGLSLEIRDRIHLINGDMRSFYLNKKYGLIIVPFNTLTYLDNKDISITLNLIKQHLANHGSVIIHVSRMDWDSNLPLKREKLWGTGTDGGKTYHYIHWVDSKNEDEKSIIYSFRHDIYEGNNIIFKTPNDSLKIWYRTYNEYTKIFVENGFKIINFWDSFSTEKDKSSGEQFIFRLVIDE